MSGSKTQRGTTFSVLLIYKHTSPHSECHVPRVHIDSLWNHVRKTPYLTLEKRTTEYTISRVQHRKRYTYFDWMLALVTPVPARFKHAVDTPHAYKDKPTLTLPKAKDKTKQL